MFDRPFVAFSDVDETLIHIKSMFDFLSYYFVGCSGIHGAAIANSCLAEIDALRREGAPRTELNRTYYRVYAGQSVEGVRRWGERWFAERARSSDFFIASTRRALTRLRNRGADLVLVSGSFDALLTPIARVVGAKTLLCTRQEIRAGYYTGAIECPMIGEHKAAAVLGYFAAHPDVDPMHCYAFGDDASDIPMLARVGWPIAVGTSPELHAYVGSRSAPSG